MKHNPKSIVLDNVGFNLEHAAQYPTAAEFIAANAHQWPGRSEEERSAALTSVWDKAQKAVASPASKSPENPKGNGESAGNVTKIPGAGSGKGNGGGNTGDGAGVNG